MTSDERAFLDAICADPADDTARLVYADWLAENGEVDRGEFIRVEIELARTPPTEEADERRRAVLFARRAELLKKHKSAWLAPFGTFAKESAFERGFVQSVEVAADEFLQHAEKWLALTPLTRVKFTTCYVRDATGNARWWIEPLFSSPHLSRLEAIEMVSLELTADDIEPLARSTLSRLRELVLRWNFLRSPGATLLANMPQLSHLEILDLRSNNINDTGARALAQSPHLDRLIELHLSRNPISRKCWNVLADRFGNALVG
jgi:uncharacterized protein (TIGR02996 family)